MRFNTKIALAAGCAGLLAMSAPAFGDPIPKPRPNAQQKSAQQKPAQQASRAQVFRANVKPNARIVRDERAPRLASMPVTSDAQRPTFGWPALVSEARKYMGTNPTDKTRLWCATFMNMVLAKTGYKGTNSDAAKSFAQYGRRISEPRVGAIAVLTRGKKGGHVGVVSGIDANGNPIIISGNHNKRVGESVYPRARVIAYVMPSESGGNTQLAVDRGSNTRTAPDGSLDSPITELLAAIEAEQSRAESPRQNATAQQAPRSSRPNVPLDPFIANFLGLNQKPQAVARPAQPMPAPQQAAPQAPPQRELRVEQTSTGRVADAGLVRNINLSR